MFKFRTIVAAVCGLSLSAVAVAQVDRDDRDKIDDRRGGYLSLTGGYTMPTDADFDVTLATPLFTTSVEEELEYDEGWSVTGAAGAYVGMFRFELEAGYRANDFDFEGEVPIVGLTDPFELDGDLQIISGMVNAYVDIPLVDRWTLYLGAGAGAAWATADFDATAVTAAGTISGSEDDDDVVFAYQGMAGVAFRATDNLSITLGYRLFNTDDFEFDSGDLDSPWIHTAEIGLRWDL